MTTRKEHPGKSWQDAASTRGEQLSPQSQSGEDVVEAPRSEARELFRGLTATELQSCIQQATRQMLGAGAFLFHPGAAGERFYLLQSGRIKIYQVSPTGRQFLLRFAMPGEVFGYWAFLPVPSATVAAQAAGQSRLLYWERKAVTHMIHQQPAIAVNILAIVARHVDELNRRFMYLLTKRVDQRIAWSLLALQPQTQQSPRSIALPKGFGHQELAEMAGTTIYTVSRVLSSWRQNGILTKRRREFVLKDPKKFAALLGDILP